MSNILFALQRFFSAPLELINGPRRFLEDMWGESDKSRALLLGFPALAVGVLGLAALAVAEFGVKDTLENRYVSAVDKVSKQKLLLLQELEKEGKVVGVANTSTGDEPADERIAQLEELRDAEKIYLNKLIEMNPIEPEYRFDLAIGVMREDPAHAVAIMKELAPDEEAGYPQAHAWLAKTYMTIPVSSRVAESENAELAMKHAEFCLKRDNNDRTAKMIKAQLLYRQKRFPAAYEIFSDLFETEAMYYEPLIRINEQRKRTDLNNSILEKALSKYRDQLEQGQLDNTNWVGVWDQMIKCYVALENFSGAEKMLVREINDLGNALDENASSEQQEIIRARLKFLNSRLASIYLVWGSKKMSAEAASPKAEKLEALELITKAYRYNPKDPNVLRLLARFAMDTDEEISNAAKAIYNPLDNPGAPSSVLNELGTSRLAQERFDEAVKFFELARKKDPKNPTILNNLSYSWLVCGEENPERALQLVDEGLRIIAGRPNMSQYQSNFLDTRGNALMRLGRYEEAIAALEQALNSRPDALGVLKQLVECYRQIGLDPETYSRRVKKIEARDAAEN